MNAKEREFHIFLKPAGSHCNLSCTYCYYLDKESSVQKRQNIHMEPEVLEKCISEQIEASAANQIDFAWHGGEPLLAGIDFYRMAVELQKRHVPEGKIILNGIQTNGTLINDEWCRFFSDNNFVIGVSIDGPSYLHDIYRRNRKGEPSFSKVKEGFLLLQEYGISTEVLCVVNAENVVYPVQVYEFFRALGAGYITFIPLVERDNDGRSSACTVPAEEYGAFLCTVFDLWKSKDVGRIKVQIFEEALRTAFNQDHTLCIFKKTCGTVPVVERNGDFYTCDHFVNADNLVGNIMGSSLASLLDSKKQKEFGAKKLLSLPRYCLDCEVRDMCNGGCPKNRFSTSPEGEPGLNYLCPGYKMIFNHISGFADTVRRVWDPSLRSG
ncbi:MAG: anaerobic sulfatase maturase [Bacteroidales bacterium]|nr:anaerobic sulfatase maturase [Bacteroidales bacterium]